MEHVKTIESLGKLVKAMRQQGKTIGFVPTMGAFHKGHMSLIETAVNQSDFVVVSIFVNPTQFAPGEDYEKYPRTIDADLKLCSDVGVDIVFTPSAEQMYPTENLTWVNVEKITAPLCGQFRPGHFQGVTTVCAKLFNIVLPDIAYFGQKDAQQAIIIKKMVSDLNIPLEIVVCPTIREDDGLALSSRNHYLDASQRQDAALIYKSLQTCRKEIENGTKEPETIIEKIRYTLQQAASIQIEYVSILDAESLNDLDNINGRVLVAVAVKIGQTRLIDNIIVDASEY